MKTATEKAREPSSWFRLNSRHKRATQRSTDSTIFAFSLDPDALGDLVQTKDIQKLQALGGIRGLEEGLRTDVLSGLSLDETYVDVPGNVPTNTKNTDSAEKLATPECRVSSELRRDVFIDRKTFYGDNRLPTQPAPSFLSLMWSAYNDHVLFLLTGAAIISLAVGLYQTFGTKHSANNPPVEWVEGVSILVAIIVITLAGAVNDYHKEYKFRKLNKKQQDRNVWVLRSGRVHEVPISDVFVGDIVQIHPGDIVPADGVLIKGHQVKCDESSATGESDPVSKTAVGGIDADRSHTGFDPFILSHTKIVEGVGSYLVLATGTSSSYGRILLSLDTDPGFTPLQMRLSSLAKNIARFGALAAIVLFVILFIKFCVSLPRSRDSPSEKGQSFLNVFILALTVVVIAVPEGLPLAVTLALSFATTRMMRDNNLVRKLQACETMGQATDICSDKTGTLTQNEMTVVSGFFGPTSQFTDRAGSPNSSVEGTSSSVAKCMGSFSDQWVSLMRQSIVINSTAVESRNSETREFLGSQTEAALLRFTQDYLGLGQLDYDRANAEVVDLLPFDSSRKFMISIVKLVNGSYRAYIKGSPGPLMKKCVATIAQPTQGIETVPLTKEAMGQICQVTRQYASRSLRTMAICFRDLDHLPFMGDGMTVDFEDVMKDLTFHGIMGIQDPLRTDARDAVETSQKAGLIVRMVTGDNALTAKSIAEECGIITGPDDVVMEGQKFRALSVGQQKSLVPRLKVLARSRPDDKRVLVERLKDLGRVVAVTGDGTNDAPALATADIGFSMGISGTEIAREASSIVLMDDRFSSIANAIMWGRTVSDAVKKFLQFQITITFTSVGLAFVSAVADSSQQSVLTPVQLMWVNLFQDTLAALALATDPPTRRVLNRKPEPKSTPLITPIMWKMIIGQSIYQMVVTLVLYFAGSSIFSYHTELQTSQLQTAIFNTYVWMQIFNMYNNRQIERSFNLLQGIHHNWLFIAVTFLMTGAQILIMFVGGRAFSITKLTGEQWAYSVVLGAISIPIGFLLQIFPTAVIEKPIGWLENMWKLVEATMVTLSVCIFLC
ncbi:ATPase P-type K/Mg/Cd/Cu/Zn/Na/Ca/Na/H-transporter [Penicillium bovifimosum]|uniref:Calcium-transporting ATPase n=1 Tax=Penicillium bovifimosum TaxID=126998 RepID=A0A9W9GIC2_9EURO|nr:ATPase P-type K/Mg/Cd/Cu/Zn/Na/Ca/Na/H-transporter [Penicillium bovifimosum]KAJ5120267.1 ATPase P-type K/Mg/Cd/Cu/Zn/Na/Ca/Na/H-transporter [Penicillium bovifimosum]